MLLFIIGVCIFYQEQANAESCHRNADNKIVLDDTAAAPVSHNGGVSFDKDWCNEEPLNYKVKIFEVKLCQSDPYVAGTGDTGADPDFSSCTNFFTRASGKDIVIQPNVKTDLLEGRVVLPVGSFGYSVIILSNELYVKHYETYIDDDNNDADIRGYAASGFSTGKTCYTHESTTTYTGHTSNVHGYKIFRSSPGDGHTLGLICTDTFDASNPPSDYDYTREIIDSIDDTCDASSDCHTTFRPYIAYQAEAKIRGRHSAVLVQDDGSTVGTDRNNSTRIAYIMAFNSPLKVTERITNFEMSFNTSTSVSIDWQADGGVTNAIKMGVDPFYVRYTVR